MDGTIIQTFETNTIVYQLQKSNIRKHIFSGVYIFLQRYIHHGPPLKQIITATNIRNKLIPLMFSISAYCSSINNRLKELSL